MDNFEKFIMALLGVLLVVCVVGLIYAPPPQRTKVFCDCNTDKVECKCWTSQNTTKSH